MQNIVNDFVGTTQFDIPLASKAKESDDKCLVTTLVEFQITVAGV